MTRLPRSAVGLANSSRVSPLVGAAGRPVCPGRQHPCAPTSPETTPKPCGWRIDQGTFFARPAPRRHRNIGRMTIFPPLVLRPGSLGRAFFMPWVGCPWLSVRHGR